jgi:hypothetical protein
MGAAAAIAVRRQVDLPSDVVADNIAPLTKNPLGICRVSKTWNEGMNLFFAWINFTNPNRKLSRYIAQVPQRLASDKKKIFWLVRLVRKHAESIFIKVELSFRSFFNPYNLQALSEEIEIRSASPYPALARMIYKPIYTFWGIPVPVLRRIDEQESFQAICHAVEERVAQLKNGLARNQRPKNEADIVERIICALKERMIQVITKWDKP